MPDAAFNPRAPMSLAEAEAMWRAEPANRHKRESYEVRIFAAALLGLISPEEEAKRLSEIREVTLALPEVVEIAARLPLGAPPDLALQIADAVADIRESGGDVDLSTLSVSRINDPDAITPQKTPPILQLLEEDEIGQPVGRA